MSKVVHLSDEAHARAKGHCQRAGLKMSEWVAVLIERAASGPWPAASDAISPRPTGVPLATPSPARALAEAPTHAGAQGHDGGLPLYAAPPFWAHGGAPSAPAVTESGGPS